MQAIYLIKHAASRITAKLRRGRTEHMSAALSRELALASPQLRADMLASIEGKKAITAVTSGSAAPACTAAAAAQADTKRVAPIAVLPNRLRYCTS
jgi:hypothetical protein